MIEMVKQFTQKKPVGAVYAMVISFDRRILSVIRNVTINGGCLNICFVIAPPRRVLYSKRMRLLRPDFIRTTAFFFILHISMPFKVGRKYAY